MERCPLCNGKLEDFITHIKCTACKTDFDETRLDIFGKIKELDNKIESILDNQLKITSVLNDILNSMRC